MMYKSQSQPLVSVVVPVYNAQKFLEQTIDSVIEQTYKNWELILVNDASTDNSLRIIEKYIAKDSRISMSSFKANVGVAQARNDGTQKAKGKYLAFLDADDLWHKNKLHKQVRFMQNQSCGFTFSGYEFADSTGAPTGTKVSVPQRISYKESLKNHIIWTSTVMIDIHMLGKNPIYMPNIRAEDTATWWQILKVVDNAHGINETLAYYRRTDNSLSANKLQAMKDSWNLYFETEKLGLMSSSYHFMWYGFNAVRKRI